MRARIIKPKLFLNEELAEVSIQARYLFTGLWCAADREGRLEDRPKQLKALIFPYDDVDVNAMLDELVKAGAIRRYESEGVRVILVINFKKHQKPHANETASSLPAEPEEATAEPVDGQALEPLDDHVAPRSHALATKALLSSCFLDLLSSCSLITPPTPPPGGETDGGTESGQPEVPPEDPPDDAVDGPAEGAALPDESKPAYGPDFERAYAAYPRHTAKGQAWKTWEKLRKSKILPALEILTSAIEAQARSPDWVRDGGRFIPHFSTWLNAHRWQDEIRQPPTATSLERSLAFLNSLDRPGQPPDEDVIDADD